MIRISTKCSFVTLSIRIPYEVTQEFTLRDLMAYVHRNFQFIIKNEKSEAMLDVIRGYFPECVSQTKKGKNIFNLEIAGDILYADFEKRYLERHNNVFPAFKQKNEQGELFEVKRPFTFMILQPVAEWGNGQAFGELALLNDKPRSATIMTVEDTHFAVLEKEDFKNIMAKTLKNKFAEQVAFLSSFPFFSGMTRITKEKLGFLLKKVKYAIGQNVITEGEDLNDFYLIESGEFEINKTV